MKILKQQINLNFGVVKLKEDTCIIFSDKNEKFSLKKNYESIGSNINDPGLVVRYEISLIMKQYERIYKKLQNVFADLGGLFNSLIVIGNIIVAQFNKKRFDFNIINKTFYRENEDSNKNLTQNKNIILNKNKKLDNFNNNLILENKSIKIQDNQNKFLEPESKLSMKSSINNVKIKQSESSFIKINNNNTKLNNTNLDINSSNLLNNNDIIKEDKIQTKRINDSTTRLNVEFKQSKIKDVKNSDVIKDNKFEKSLDINQAKKIILKERIQLFIENQNKKNNRKKLVKLSKLEFFFHFLPCKIFKNQSLIQKEHLILRAEDKVAEYLDVCSYTKLIENVHKLKVIFLNKYQKLSFEYLMNRNTTDLFKENYDNKLLETIQYYKQKIKESNLNEYDQKLLDNISKEFKELIISKT